MSQPATPAYDRDRLVELFGNDPKTLAEVEREFVETAREAEREIADADDLETIARAWFPDGRQAVAIDLAALAVPVQLIWGQGDRIIAAADAEALAGRLPVHILDAAGHLPHMEKSGEVNRLITRFIATA